MVALITNFCSGLPAGMLPADVGAYNAVSSPRHQVWRRAPCWDADVRRRCRRRLWRSWSPSLAAGSLRGYCRPTVAQKRFSAALAIKFSGRIPTGTLLADGGADDAFGGPGHQVWRRDPCGDDAGQRRHRQRLWRPWSPSLAAGSLWPCCRRTSAQEPSRRPSPSSLTAGSLLGCCWPMAS